MSCLIGNLEVAIARGRVRKVNGVSTISELLEFSIAGCTCPSSCSNISRRNNFVVAYGVSCCNQRQLADNLRRIASCFIHDTGLAADINLVG